MASDGTNRVLQYRYSVSASGMVNAFRPRELTKEAGETDKIRAAQLGALFSGRFSQLNRGDNAGIIWEAWWKEISTTETIAQTMVVNADLDLDACSLCSPTFFNRLCPPADLSKSFFASGQDR